MGRKTTTAKQKRPRSRRGVTVTLRDIAAEVGVSVAAVSYVINGRDEEVAEETRKRILEVVHKYDYQPNLLMRAVRTQRTNVVGVLVPSFGTTFFPQIIDSIERELAGGGYHAVMCQTHTRDDVTEENLRVLRERRVDGVIAVPTHGQTSIYRRIVKAGVPVVFIDSHLSSLPVPSVQSDDVLGAQLVVRHLIAKGHRRIATMRMPDALLHGTAKARFDGYSLALQEAGVPFVKKRVIAVDSGYGVAEGYTATQALLNEGSSTALFAPMDMAALGALRAASDVGVSVPDDFAIVGYCNQEAGMYTTPRLTTVDQKPEAIGLAAVKRLLGMIEEGTTPRPKHLKVEPELLVRESSPQTGEIASSDLTEIP